MPYMAETEIMTLGRIGAFGQVADRAWLQNRRVTPQQPQNLLRAVTLSGVHRTARLLSGLGVVGDQVIENTTGQQAITSGEPVAMNFPSLPMLPWEKQPIGVQIGTIVAGGALVIVSAGISAYHGYRRDRSVMAGVGWGFVGSLFPVITPIIAFAQGYARPRRR